ncbi:MAG: type IV toxin-antitoxin system AbiEi family antitoxin domain-containing protein [Thermoleophilia bacterium]
MERTQTPIVRLRAQIEGEEFDYLTLLGSLGEFAFPRDKITTLLRRGDIIRVKKGFYVFGHAHARRPYSREVLANMLYGPSYVSLDYALQYHGLIPEGVEAVTSMTTGRARRFLTPVGLFVYRPATLAAYPLGVHLVQIEGGSFLIAGPEKALTDRVRTDRGSAVRTIGEMERHLLDDLRIDPTSLAELDTERLSQIAAAYGSRKLRLLTAVVHSLRSAAQTEASRR